MTKLTIDEAKRIVLEKHPDAKFYVHRSGLCYISDGTFRLSEVFSSRTKWAKKQAWLSAAHRIQKEKDK